MGKGNCLKVNLTEKKGIFKIPKGKAEYLVIDKDKCYPIRGGNNLSKIRKWKKQANKDYPSQKIIIVDNINNMQDKLSKMRRKVDLDSRYTAYGTY